MSTNQNPLAASVSRRQFINTAALATAGAALASRSTFAAAAPAAAAPASANTTAAVEYGKALVEKYGRPNSKFNGVQVGTITYSFRSMPTSAEEVLKYCVKIGRAHV